MKNIFKKTSLILVSTVIAMSLIGCSGTGGSHSQEDVSNRVLSANNMSKSLDNAKVTVSFKEAKSGMEAYTYTVTGKANRDICTGRIFLGKCKAGKFYKAGSDIEKTGTVTMIAAK